LQALQRSCHWQMQCRPPRTIIMMRHRGTKFSLHLCVSSGHDTPGPGGCQ
jgi:hypothetical protein